MSAVPNAGQAVVGLAFFCAAASALAGAFAVSPGRATLAAGQQAVALNVKNEGKEPAVLQLETMRWSQHEGRDVYEPTREILATPPLFTLAPGATQIVRIGLRREADAERELAYRVFVQEVPQGAVAVRGLQVALRLGIPVFVTAARAAPQARWQATRTSEGVRLALANEGAAHLQVIELRAKLGAREVAHVGMPSYVLPGQRREWHWAAPAGAPGPLRISARTDAGDLEQDVPLE
jgi:fimbrial chaperone protein